MIVKEIKTRIFQEGENLESFISTYVPRLKEHSILVVTSKIVALAERRTVVAKDAKAKERLIRAESDVALETKYCWMTIKDDMVMAAAGIDESNANGKLILLPRDSHRSAGVLRKAFMKKFGLKQLGVIITDSRTMPLRAGVTGVAIGYAGFRGVRDYRGKPDLFGRLLHVSRTDVADSLATAAVLLMGEAKECQPLATIEDAPVEFCERIDRNELKISLEDDMYRPLFTHLPKKRKIGVTSQK